MKHSKHYFWGGILTMALGLIVLFNAALASGAIVIVTGVLLLIGGAGQVAIGFMENRADGKWMAIVIGALTFLLGWLFLSNPLSGILSLSTLLLVLMAASGIIQIVFGFRAHGTSFFWPLMATGGLSLILALVVLSMPAATMAVLGVLLGINLIGSGASLTMMGVLMNRLKRSTQ